MTGVLLALTGVSAAADWIAVYRSEKRLEYVFKPLVLVFLIAVAVVERDQAGDAAPWLLGALAFSLAGDVFLMLPRDLFVPGLGSFLIAHVCYVGAFQPGLPDFVGEWVAIAVLLLGGVLLFVRLLEGLRSKALVELIAPVGLYAVVISVMAYSGLSYSGTAATGAILFYASDSLIGWSRFVGKIPHSDVDIHVTYHCAQILLVLSLIR